MVENTCRVFPGTHFSVLPSLTRVSTAMAAWIGGPLLAAGYFHAAFGLAYIGYGLSLIALHLNTNHFKK